MESNPLRGLFVVSSPRPVEKRVAPQPTEPTENIYFEIPSGMIEKLLANPFTRFSLNISEFLVQIIPEGGALMTHKYRGSIVVLSISKSVEPNEEQKEMTSGFQ